MKDTKKTKMNKAKDKYEKLKHEVKTQSKVKVKKQPKPIPVKMLIIEPHKLTEYDISLTNEKELKIDHEGRSLTLKRDDIIHKTFVETNWHGGIKHLFAFCKLPEKGTPDLIGINEFDPYTMISSDEADIMVHEDVTMRGVKHLVTKVTGAGGPTRIWLLLGIILIVIIALVMKSQGMIG